MVSKREDGTAFHNFTQMSPRIKGDGLTCLLFFPILSAPRDTC